MMLVDKIVLNFVARFVKICHQIVKPVVDFQFINFVLWSVEIVSGSLPAHLL